MENYLCNGKLSAVDVPCNEHHVNELKTLKIDVTDAEGIKAIIEDHRRTGQPIVIDASHISIASAIYSSRAAIKPLPMAVCTPIQPALLFKDCIVPIQNKAIEIKPLLIPDLVTPEMEMIRDKVKASDLQLKELELADIPEDTKKLIAVEFKRLRKQHPNWKVSKAMRKAGEKYNVKFIPE